MLGFLTRSIAHRDSQPTIPAEESEGEQEEEDGVQIPGMPPAPKSITLSDPYPEGKLSGRNPVANAAPSKTPPDSADVGGPLEHDGSTTIIFVKAGSEHRALLYLMQKVGVPHYFQPRTLRDVAGHDGLCLWGQRDRTVPRLSPLPLRMCPSCGFWAACIEFCLPA